MTTLYFDAFSGASGDMILGALVDLGADFTALRRALAPLARGRFELRRRRIVAQSLAATRITVKIVARAEDEAERNFREIAAIVKGGKLPAPARDLAIEIFRGLCEAEAFVHGVRFDQVHLHEAGAIDAIADVCGAAWLIHELQPGRIMASPLNVGSGTLECRHGTYPVPGPATARLLRGVPIYAEGAPGERVTPTGAAILRTIVREYGLLPAMIVRAVGNGAGTRVFADRPNVLRAILGEDPPVVSEEIAAAHPLQSLKRAGALAFSTSSVSSTASPRTTGALSAASAGSPPAGIRVRAAKGAGPQAAGGPARGGEVVVIETTIDDMNPQLYTHFLGRCLRAGALDVFLAPIIMKKGRPGVNVTVLTPPERFDAISHVIFQETTTIGFRYRRESRRELERTFVAVTTAYGKLRLKISSEAGVVLQVQPEFEDCRRIAQAQGVALKEVMRAALAAWSPPGKHRARGAHPKSARQNRRGTRT